MRAEAKKQTILSQNYLTKAVAASYSEIAGSYDVSEESLLIVKTLARIRDDVIASIGQAVPGAIGRQSELDHVCELIGATVKTSMEEAAAKYGLSPMVVTDLTGAIFSERRKVKAMIGEKYDLEMGEQKLELGDDYMYNLEPALLQFQIYFSKLLSPVYEDKGGYLCGRCERIHTKSTSDQDLLNVMQQLADDALNKIIEDVKHMQYLKKPFRFSDLVRTFRNFLNKRRGNLKMCYGIKGPALAELRDFANGVFTDTEHLAESDFLEAGIHPKFSAIFGNTRAFYRKKVLDGMKRHELRNLCAEVDECDPDSAVSALGVPQVQVPGTDADVPVVECEPPAASPEVSPLPEAPPSPFQPIPDAYRESPDEFSNRLALLIYEPFFTEALQQGLYCCTRCNDLHANDATLIVDFKTVDTFLWKTLQIVDEQVKPLLNQGAAEGFGLGQLRDRVLEFLGSRLSTYVQSNSKSKLCGHTQKKQELLEKVIARIAHMPIEDFGAMRFEGMAPGVLQAVNLRMSMYAFDPTPCKAALWKDVLDAKAVGEKPAAQPEEEPVQAAESVTCEVASEDVTGDAVTEDANEDVTGGESGPVEAPVLTDPVIAGRETRIQSVVEWFGQFPEMQKKTYIRHEIAALIQVLSAPEEHPKSLVTYALLKLEAFRDQIDFEETTKAFSTSLDSDELMSLYVRIFRELSFENPARSASARIVQERLREFQAVISGLEEEYFRLESDFGDGVDGAEQAILSFESERAGLFAEKALADGRRSALFESLPSLLKEDHFTEMRVHISESRKLKARIGEIDARIDEIQKELGALVESRDLRRKTAGQMASVKSRLEAVHQRRRQFVRDVRVLLLHTYQESAQFHSSKA